jgi:hypothetical protein
VRAAIKALPLPLEDLREFQQQESLARRERSKKLRIGNCSALNEWTYTCQDEAPANR